MNLLKPLAIFTFVFLFYQNISAQQRVWTLRECIDFAMDNNVSIKQGNLGLEATKIVSQQAKLSYIPDGGIQSGYQLDNPEHMHPVQKEKESQIGSKRFDLNSHSGRYAPIFREK